MDCRFKKEMYSYPVASTDINQYQIQMGNCLLDGYEEKGS